MSESANVQKSALSDMKLALTRFADQTKESLLSINSEIRRTLDWIQNAINERRRTVKRRHEEVECALDALRDCRRRGDDDGDADCSYEESELERARRRLEDAEYDLERSHRWQRQIEDAIERFRKYTARLESLTGVQGERGKSFLEQKIDVLEKYQYNTMLSSSQTGTIDSPHSSTGSAGGQSSMAVASSTAKVADYSSNNWVEKGIQDVVVSSLPDDGELNGPANFHKVKLDEMKAGLQRFQQMLPVIKSGVGANKDYWRQIDKQRGLNYSNGYLRIYEAFYGQDAIRVVKIGNNYDVINGRHRIWLAKQMGIKTLPAMVIAQF